MGIITSFLDAINFQIACLYLTSAKIIDTMNKLPVHSIERIIKDILLYIAISFVLSVFIFKFFDNLSYKYIWDAAERSYP